MRVESGAGAQSITRLAALVLGSGETGPDQGDGEWAEEGVNTKTLRSRMNQTQEHKGRGEFPLEAK